MTPQEILGAMEDPKFFSKPVEDREQVLAQACKTLLKYSMLTLKLESSTICAVIGNAVRPDW